MNSIKQRTISGIQWSLIEKIITVLTSFVFSIILARILGPTNYGLIGVVSIFVFVIQGIVDSGFSAALIRKETVNEEDYSTSFFFNLAASIFLYLILYFAAPTISIFFRQEKILVSLLKVMGIIVIINAISITQVTKLTRKMDFKTQAKVSIISSFIGGIIGILMAFKGYGVWSLVGQQIVFSFIRCVLLITFNKWIPTFKLSKESFKYLIGFGWKITVSNLITSVWVQGNKIIIGRMYSPATLGFYTKAKDLPNNIVSNLSTVINNVSYTALSKLQADTVSLKSAYRRVLKMTFYLSSNITLGISAIAVPLIYALFGNEWLQAGKYLQIVSLSSLFYAPIIITLSMLKIKNRTDLFLKLEIVAKTFAIIPFALGIKYGIMWLIWGSVALSLFQYIMDSYITGKLINYSLTELLKDLLPSIVISFTMFICVKALSLIQTSYYLLLPIQIFTGITIVVLLSKILKITEYMECMDFIKNSFKKVSRKS